jgi:hypothetical protein
MCGLITGVSAYGACQSAVGRATDKTQRRTMVEASRGRASEPSADYLVFRGAAFLAAAFLGAAFLTAAFFTATFFTAAFLGAAFLAAAFFGAVFLTAAFLTAVFFTAAFFAAGALVAAFLAAFFLATSQTSVNGTRKKSNRLPHKQSSASLEFHPCLRTTSAVPDGARPEAPTSSARAREIVDMDEQQLTDGTDTSSGLYLYETTPAMQHLFDNFSTKI